MNLSPVWVSYLSGQGIESVHWSAVGAANAPDAEVMEWAREHGCVVFTHDLDFGILLAHRKDKGPSVVQARTDDLSPDRFGPVMVMALKAHQSVLEEGALLTVDPSKSRVRILPI
jgi:predicted nuclease of predicted toxin-antitoxin system